VGLPRLGGAAAKAGRRGYLDWLRGIAVLIMIEAHTLDSWTMPAERTGDAYRWAVILGGFGAPIFLFLAGVGLALGAGSRLRKGASPAEAARLARRRGWQIFGLAFLFRLFTLAASGGSFAKLVKVDILNIMGLAMLGAAVLWGLGRGPRMRAAWLTMAAAAVAFATPIVRPTSLLDPLPDVVEWYFRAPQGRTMFNLFPWSAFLLAGAAAGVWLDAARDPQRERRINLSLAVAGTGLAAGAYAASYLPSPFAGSDFWTSSPAFFFLRLGILLTAVPVAYAIRAAWPGRSRIEEFGIASLFVYWIHVEIVYGLLTLPIHRALTLEQVAIGFVLFTLLMFGLVKLKDRFVGKGRSGRTGPATDYGLQTTN
jgi:uncharacterized membrane protein